MIVTADNAGAAPLIANRTAVAHGNSSDEIDLATGAISHCAPRQQQHRDRRQRGCRTGESPQNRGSAVETFNLIHSGDGSGQPRGDGEQQHVTADNARRVPVDRQPARRSAAWEEFDLIMIE